MWIRFLTNRLYPFLHVGGRVLLCRTGMYDIEVWSRLRVHHADVWPVYSFHATVGGVHDRQALFSGHRRAHVQPVRTETDVPRLQSARRVHSSAGRLLYRYNIIN